MKKRHNVPADVIGIIVRQAFSWSCSALLEVSKCCRTHDDNSWMSFQQKPISDLTSMKMPKYSIEDNNV